MKLSAALTLLCVAYVGNAAKTVVKSAQLMKTLAAVPGAGVRVAALPILNTMSFATGGSEAVTAKVSSDTNLLGSTVTHENTTHQSTGAQIQNGFSDNGYYIPYFPGGYTGYVSGAHSGLYGGAHPSYLKWDYPGLSGAFYPDFFPSTRRGFLSALYPGLLEASQQGLYGGADSRYLSGLYPGLFGGAYGSLYGSRFFSSGALERVRTHFAGYQREVAVTVDPLTGLPSPVSSPVANRVLTIERLVPFPSPYPVPVPAPYPAQIPVPYTEVSKPVSSSIDIGSTTAASQGGQVIPVLDGSVVVSGQKQQALAERQFQAHVRL